ncbi:hypothetical protein Q1695_013700 [Nippostrongylus brasiliensis]|nr:hypothetical protein Q1695_013700 [Nippostrongylus brasiliensis]
MTPAAVPYDPPTAQASFRRTHCIVDGRSAAVNGMKKLVKRRPRNGKSTNAPCGEMESYDEDNNRTRAGHNTSRIDGFPSTSGRCLGDRHVEVSDEDTGFGSFRYEYIKKEGDDGSKEHCDIREDGFIAKDGCLGSVLDDRSTFLDGSSRRNYYIIRRDGRLAEIFRTDLFDRLRKGIDANEDSDDDQVPGRGLARMTDRWRAEWSHGTQVPLQAENVNPAEVRRSVVECASSKLNRAQRKRKRVITNFFEKPYASVPSTILRLYECTALDQVWVNLYNQRKNSQSPELHMEVFLELMNDFEIECYKNIHRKLLEPLHSPSSRADDADEEAACDICRAIDSEPDDEMVFCDGCNLCVHMSCYGLPELPPDEWLCMKCKLSFGRNPPCILCPTIGGALKRVDKTEQWAHVVCALWIPECRFGDVEKREPIIRIHEISEERWAAKCSICDTRQGACIKCSVDSCKAPFHATCALRSGLEMRIEQDQKEDKVNMISLCCKHRSAKPFASSESLRDSCQDASTCDSDATPYCSPLEKLEKTCYIFVDRFEIASRLNFDPAVVDDVFAYWVHRRLHLNAGKPLIDNLQDEVKIVEPDPPELQLPAYSGLRLSTPTVLIERKRGRPKKKVTASESTSKKEAYVIDEADRRLTRAAYEKLDMSLSKGRTLLELVRQKCKEQRRFLNAHLSALLLIAEHLSKPVPLSSRTLSYLNETMEILCSKQVIDEGDRRADEICSVIDYSTPRESPFPQSSNNGSVLDETPTSSSSSDSHYLPGRRDCSSPVHRMSSGCDKATAVAACRRSRVKPSPARKLGSKLNCTPLADPTQQPNCRRKKLRSTNAKSTVEDEEELRKKKNGSTPEVAVPSRRPNISLDMRKHISDSCLDDFTAKVVEEKHNFATHVTRGKLSVGEAKNRRKRRRTELKLLFDATESFSAKRQRILSPSAELRLLKSLNLKSASKDCKHRLRNFNFSRGCQENVRVQNSKSPTDSSPTSRHRERSKGRASVTGRVVDGRIASAR